MQRYGNRRLAGKGWSVSASRRLDEAVDGAAIVVNQIRFGGLAGRARDEELAARFQLPADETLGPCGLSAALRVAPRMRALGAELGRHCKDAWVLNLANPLSLTTALLVKAGAPARCVGLCELPRATAMEACRVLQVPFDEIDWRYAGLNHRGFIFSLRHRGQELLPQLPERLIGESIFGITGSEIRKLSALPLKYFRLLEAADGAATQGRARFLSGLKEDLARELDAMDGPPPSLSRRDLDWYRDAVVPMILAIFTGDGRPVMVNCLREDGLVAELPARVSPQGVEPLPQQAPARLSHWLDRWAAHERALLEAIESPDLPCIEAALALDPLVPHAAVRELARAILAGSEDDP